MVNYLPKERKVTPLQSQQILTLKKIEMPFLEKIKKAQTSFQTGAPTQSQKVKIIETLPLKRMLSEKGNLYFLLRKEHINQLFLQAERKEKMPTRTLL